MAITAKENLIKLWKRQGYEYAPPHFSMCPTLVEQYEKRYGSSIDYQDRFNFPFRFVGFHYKPQNVDWKSYYPGIEFNPGTTFSEFGVAHEPHEGSMHMTRMHHPMQNFTNIEQFQAYPYPEIDETKFDTMKTQIDQLHERGLAAGGGVIPLWEFPWYMRSMEELMIDMLEESPAAIYHFNRITELSCERAAYFARAGADFLHVGDDIGMQNTIMMSEELYREWIKPRFAKLIKTAKSINPDILFSYHSCGYIEPFIPDLIEVGIDVLNPIQPECMSFEKIHAEYGNVLSFWGTVGTQSTMPFGTPAEVKEAVFRNLETAGSKGGLLCTPTHLLEPEVPWENIEAYLEACKEFEP